MNKHPEYFVDGSILEKIIPDRTVTNKLLGKESLDSIPITLEQGQEEQNVIVVLSGDTHNQEDNM